MFKILLLLLLPFFANATTSVTAVTYQSINGKAVAILGNTTSVADATATQLIATGQAILASTVLPPINVNIPTFGTYTSLSSAVSAGGLNPGFYQVLTGAGINGGYVYDGSNLWMTVDTSGGLIATAGTCVGAADGICASYSTGVGYISVGAADSLSFSVNGSASTTLDQYGRVRHAQLAGSPTVGTCGTTPSITGNDQNFKVTFGSGVPTACTVTFANAWATAPSVCNFTPASSTAAAATVLGWVNSISTTAVVFGGGALAGSYYVHCE